MLQYYVNRNTEQSLDGILKPFQLQILLTMKIIHLYIKMLRRPHQFYVHMDGQQMTNIIKLTVFHCESIDSSLSPST